MLPRKQRVFVSLDERTLQEAALLGSGNKSSGIRRAFSLLRVRPEIIASVTEAEMLSASPPDDLADMSQVGKDLFMQHSEPAKSEPRYKGNHRSVYLGADEWLIAKDLGRGNISAGIRAALLAARLKLI